MISGHGADVLNTALLRWLDELSNQGVLSTDRDLKILGWNQWLERHTGHSAADVIGRPLFEVYPELVERGLDRYYLAALEGEVSVLAQSLHRYLLRLPARDGSPDAMPQSARVAPLEYEGAVVGTITTIDDVSERVAREAEMRRQITAADAARVVAEDTLRIKDEFLATLSHEIRTPLNAVVGWTKLLLGRKVDEATLQRALAVIDRNATAQARLIEDMLDMARIVSGKLRLELGPVDLVTATAAAIDVVMPAAVAKGVTIRPDLGVGSSAIIADNDRVQQIVWNVLANAVKFTPAGGAVDVTIEPGDADVRLIVRDTGDGIAPEFLPHVFERFRQANASTSRTEGGLGLGLALVRQLIELHGGTVTVDSEGRGKGVSVTLTFPAPRVSAIAEEKLPPSYTPSLQSVHLMIVDDDPDWRELLSVALADAGATVETAESSARALEILTSALEPPTVLIVDIAMPVDDGYSLLSRIRQLPGPAAAVPAIAVTAYSGEEHAHRALAAGFHLHRSKPLTPAAVAAAVQEVLRSSSRS